MSGNIETSIRSTSNLVVEGQPQQLQSIDIKKAKGVKKQVKQKIINKSKVSVTSAAETSVIAEKSLETTQTTTEIILEKVSSNNIIDENKIMSSDLEKTEILSCRIPKSINQKTDSNELSENCTPKIKHGKKNTSSSTSSLTNGGRQSRKVKKSNLEKENISVKSSFSKFDELQKRNLMHVRSRDAGNSQETISDTKSDKKQNCHVCKKEVYKMEEINAEKNVYHKLCFRCNECEKQLKVDNYQSHEGVLYCKAHFKLLFMPKFVEKTVQDVPKKPELIIRENQPVELPPDVIRASIKPDLGLEELQQINIRSKFEAFEKSTPLQTETKNIERTPSITGVKRSGSILSKLSKFQEKVTNNNCTEEDSEEKSTPDDESADTDVEMENDVDLVRAKRSQRERPVRLDNMKDIKSKFESGHIISKDERREERKHEIQNIRSRLFLGKQARIKEMYQQAVAESEHGIISVGKKPVIDVGDKARYLKEKFENGEIFKEDDEVLKVPDDELEVFQSAISKKSRSLFQELDASAAKNQLTPKKQLPLLNDNSRVRLFDDKHIFDSNSRDGIVKHDEKIDDIQVETSDIVSKFKFFETYKPAKNKMKTFRITPPRDEVITLESDEEQETTTTQDIEPIEKTHTTTIMLNKFRELEQIRNNNMDQLGPRPLKCFTPPPDDGRRIYASHEDLSVEEDEEEYEEEDERDDENYEDEDEDDDIYYYGTKSSHHLQDEALIQAQATARAKQLRAKFEKWEANEIKRETQDGTINLYEDNSEENHIESAKAIRAKFENMKENQSTQVVRPRYKVNRFV